jgi:nitronate monooxygenase
MFKTRVTEILGIKYPIIAGPMAYVSQPEFVAAVSDADGFGIMAGIMYRSPDDLRAAIKKTKSLTNKPFAVNITMLPISRPINYEEYFIAALDEGAKIIETSGRSPEPYMKLMKDAGVITMHRATRTGDIKTAEEAGIDIVTILGTEAAGHPGQEEVGSIVRIPVAVNTVKIPVIAGGGIADARGFVAAMALGAEGVLMGTRFMVSKEAIIHDNAKKWMTTLSEADTILIMKSVKNASRVVRNSITEQVLDLENKGAPFDQILPLVRGARGASAFQTGQVENASITIGQCIGLIRDIPSIKEIIDGIVRDAKPIMQRLRAMGVGE